MFGSQVTTETLDILRQTTSIILHIIISIAIMICGTGRMGMLYIP